MRISYITNGQLWNLQFLHATSIPATVRRQFIHYQFDVRSNAANWGRITLSLSRMGENSREVPLW